MSTVTQIKNKNCKLDPLPLFLWSLFDFYIKKTCLKCIVIQQSSYFEPVSITQEGDHMKPYVIRDKIFFLNERAEIDNSNYSIENKHLKYSYCICKFIFILSFCPSMLQISLIFIISCISLKSSCFLFKNS